jgi:hypothetical protein
LTQTGDHFDITDEENYVTPTKMTKRERDIFHDKMFDDPSAKHLNFDGETSKSK